MLGSEPWAKEFYLAGGTGLALQLGHRVSVDLDFFSISEQLTEVFREQVVANLEAKGVKTVVELSEGRTLKLIVGGVAVSLFHYPYPLVGPVVEPPGLPPIASLEDIGLMKLTAIIGRGVRRDFIDLYFICCVIGLERLATLSSKKFEKVRDLGVQAARALTYFAEAERDAEPEMLKDVDWKQVKGYFEARVVRLGREWFELS